jgi:hypothetical protein
MKKSRYVAALILALFLSPLAHAAENTPLEQSFAWDDSRVDVGYCYRYRFTDMKGRGPIEYFLYISGKDEYQELYNMYQGKYTKAIGLFTAKLDTERLRYASVRVDNLLPAQDKSFRYYDEAFDHERKKLLYSGVEIKKGKDNPVKAEVGYESNTYRAGEIGAEFQIFFRHVKDDAKPFVLRYQDALNRTYSMDCRFEKEETVDGTLCRKYLIEGQGALAKTLNVKGAVWLAKDDPARYMVKHTMNMRVEWEHDSTLVVLVERKPMSPEEWKALQAEVVEKQKSALSF